LQLKTDKGFSLIEVMIVVAIIAVVLAMAGPSFNEYRQNTNLKEATRELAGDISLWRQAAIAENARYRLLFNQGGNTYTVQIENPANFGTYVNLSAVNPSINDTKSPGSFSSAIVITSANFTSGQAFITFQPRGTMSAGTVWLQHSGRLSTSTITTNLLGRVNVAYDIK